MSGDSKEFNRRNLNEDLTKLSMATKVLDFLKVRWVDRVEELDVTIKSLLRFRTLLISEGHKGYIPKVKELAEGFAIVEAADLAEAIEAERITEELRLKKEAEAEKKALALAEKKRLAEEKAKKVAEQKVKAQEEKAFAKAKAIQDAVDAKAKVLAEKKAAKLAELEELKAAKLLELEALNELKEETEEEV